MNSQTNQNHTALENALKQHLKAGQLPQFEGYLLSKITNRIEYEKQLKILKPKLWSAAFTLLASIGLLVFASIYSWTAFAQTPISQFLHLIFTDSRLILDNWQDYVLSILENIPLGASALMLGAVLTSFWLIDFGTRQLINLKHLTHNNHYGKL